MLSSSVLLPSEHQGSPEAYLSALASFIYSCEWLLGHVWVNFFVDNIWAEVPSDISAVLSTLSEDELLDLAQGEIKGFRVFMHATRSLAIPSMSDERKFNLHPSLHYGLNPKKKHEVGRLLHLISQLVSETPVSHVIDIGAGKGYISHALLLHLRLSVTLVESSTLNTQAAQRRFDSCKTNMLRRKGQEELSNLAVDQLRSCKGYLGLLPEAALRQVASYWLRVPLLSPPTTVVLRVEPAIDPKAFAKASQPRSDSHDQTHRQLLLSLHACGDLSCTAMRTFANSTDASLFVNVPCCYHALTIRTAATPEQSAEMFGFPMSNQLKQLGRVPFDAAGGLRCIDDPAVGGEENSANKPTAQVLAKRRRNGRLAYRKQFYRALLQTLVPELHLPHITNAHFRDFRTYARHAVSLLKFSAVIGDEHIDACWVKHGAQQGKVAAMWTLKALLAPCTESLVLIDRFLYFKERGFATALLPLFDKCLSPRSFALVAKR